MLLPAIDTILYFRATISPCEARKTSSPCSKNACREPFDRVAVPKNFRLIGGQDGGHVGLEEDQYGSADPALSVLACDSPSESPASALRHQRENIPPRPRIHQVLGPQHRTFIQRRIKVPRSRRKLLRLDSRGVPRRQCSRLRSIIARRTRSRRIRLLRNLGVICVDCMRNPGWRRRRGPGVSSASQAGCKETYPTAITAQVPSARRPTIVFLRFSVPTFIAASRSSGSSA